MKLFLTMLSMLLVTASHAQATAPDSSLPDLLKWVGNQQAQVGTSIDLHGTKYAASWWDAVSFGQGGLDVGKAGALDYLDLGIGAVATNGRAPRYGQALAFHAGNIWNTAQTSSHGTWMSHVHLVALPNVTVSPLFLLPERKPINKWTWEEDFQVAVCYRFGGS